jgi:hypothetical protein
MSVSGGYYRRQFYDIQYTMNRAIDPTRDFTPFTIVVPSTPNLPGGGGQVIRLYNRSNATTGVNDNITNWSTNNTRIYNGFEVSINARLPKGFLFGGITTERTATDNCTDLTASNPNNLRFCEQTPAFRTLYKGSGSYSLPYNVQLSGSFQLRPGISIGSDYTYTCSAAQAAATGCTALTGGITSLTTPVLSPTDQYYDYVTTNDIRIARGFRHGRVRFQPFMEIFNLMNFSTILTVNETIGPNYQTPAVIVPARRAQFGATIEW